MKIKKLVEIICDELEWDDEILEHYEPNDALVYYTNKTIYVRAELSILIFSIDDKGTYRKNQRVIKTYSIGSLEFDMELFTAIDCILRNIYECDEDEMVETVSACAKRVRSEITMKLDFSEILNMENLIETVKNNKHYSTLLFSVERYNCMEKDKYRSYNSNPMKYKFGNRDYRREIDVVDIEIYDDFTSLHYRKEGSKHHDQQTKNDGKSTEQEILYALGLWENFFW